MQLRARRASFGATQGGCNEEMAMRAGGGCLVEYGFCRRPWRELSQQGGYTGRDGGPGRRDRYSREGAWTTNGKDLGPTGRRREQARRFEPDRRGGCRKRGARRLH